MIVPFPGSAKLVCGHDCDLPAVLVGGGFSSGGKNVSEIPATQESFTRIGTFAHAVHLRIFDPWLKRGDEGGHLPFRFDSEKAWPKIIHLEFGGDDATLKHDVAAAPESQEEIDACVLIFVVGNVVFFD